MSGLLKTLLIGAIILLGGMLSLSCAKKTTGPSSSGDIENQLKNCDWRVSIDAESLDESVYIEYQSRTPLNTIPTVNVSIDEINCILSYENDFMAEGWYIYYAHLRYPSQFTPGQSYQITLTVNGISTSASLEMICPITITEAPETFDPTQANIIRWHQDKSGNLQTAYLYWHYGDDYNTGECDVIIPPSDRYYVVPANTVPVNWTYIEGQISSYNVKIAGKVAFMADTWVKLLYNSGYYPTEISRNERAKNQHVFRQKRNMTAIEK